MNPQQDNRLLLRQRRSIGPEWQDRQFNPRLLARERLQERDDSVFLLFGQLLAELASAHDGHRLLQAPNLAGMKVRCSQCHVAQRARAENILVAEHLGYREASLVVRRQDVRAGLCDHAKGEISPATHVDSVVAGRAALIHEEFQALLFLRIQSIGVAFEKLIKAGSRGYQCRFKRL